jgi:hypothetical protein
VLAKALILPAGVCVVGQLLLVHQLLHLSLCEPAAAAAAAAVIAVQAAAAAAKQRQQRQESNGTSTILTQTCLPGLKSLPKLPPELAAHVSCRLTTWTAQQICPGWLPDAPM